MDEEKMKKLIDKAAVECMEQEGPRYGLTAEEVEESAKRMKDPEYRAKIRAFAKEEIRKRKNDTGVKE